jgi:hypothetical protein
MLRFHPTHLNLIMLCSVFVLSFSVATPQDKYAHKVQYEIIDVGSLGGTVARARCVNDFGGVIGAGGCRGQIPIRLSLARWQNGGLGNFGGVASQGMKGERSASNSWQLLFQSVSS